MNLKEVASKLEQQSRQYHQAAQLLLQLAASDPEPKKPMGRVVALSAEARQRISAAQKARWRKIKEGRKAA